MTGKRLTNSKVEEVEAVSDVDCINMCVLHDVCDSAPRTSSWLLLVLYRPSSPTKHLHHEATIVGCSLFTAAALLSLSSMLSYTAASADATSVTRSTIVHPSRPVSSILIRHPQLLDPVLTTWSPTITG